MSVVFVVGVECLSAILQSATLALYPEVAEEVHVQDGADVDLAALLGRALGVDEAGVVDEDVHGTEVGGDGLTQRPHILYLGHVAEVRLGIQAR